MRNDSNFSVQKLQGKRPKGTPRHNGEDNTEMYIIFFSEHDAMVGF
jgi:hypothetical protein